MNKQFFQEAWGEQGYYEYFSYGVGIDKVCEVALYPFFDSSKDVLEIGSGGGTFTEKIIGKCFCLWAIDVINKPSKFEAYKRFRYIELPDNTYKCLGVPDSRIDFCFSYNTFCHFSNTQMKEYITDVNRVLKTGGDFVFMLSDFNYTKNKTLDWYKYQLGDLLPMGHYYQDERTLEIITDKDKWEIVSENMIPEHRDIIVHLKKK